MAWTDMPVATWNEIVGLFQSLDYGRPGGAPYLFRGQSDANWGLHDTLSRIIKSGCGRVDPTELEMTAYETFVAQAHLILDPSALPVFESLLGWWGLMQHFGAQLGFSTGVRRPTPRSISPRWMTGNDPGWFGLLTRKRSRKHSTAQRPIAQERSLQKKRTQGTLFGLTPPLT